MIPYKKLPLLPLCRYFPAHSRNVSPRCIQYWHLLQVSFTNARFLNSLPGKQGIHSISLTCILHRMFRIFDSLVTDIFFWYYTKKYRYCRYAVIAGNWYHTAWFKIHCIKHPRSIPAAKYSFGAWYHYFLKSFYLQQIWYIQNIIPSIFNVICIWIPWSVCSWYSKITIQLMIQSYHLEIMQRSDTPSILNKPIISSFLHLYYWQIWRTGIHCQKHTKEKSSLR